MLSHINVIFILYNMSVEHIVSEDGSTYYDMKYNLVSLDTFYDCLLKHDYSRLRGMGDNIDSIVFYGTRY